ncbi:unnamed protein product [Linum tenue]|uniref:Uncharacterized protein n=1 Tax=Linum tenue TaxID=586396 RepID=A0AAV0MYS2_9ROSI|nr:unnamed protein product [Linum tenue]
MAEFNTQHWQNKASHDHPSSFVGMGSSINSIQIAPPGLVTMDNKSGSVSSHDHHFPLSFPDYSFFALHHHYGPQALASTPAVETPSVVAAAAAAAGITPSSSINVDEKRCSSVRRSRKKASDNDEVVHVRARKGQATDSHSAAERSMGMAVMLEEIINYVCSLQNQVEFLSMELAAAAAAANSVNLETQPSRSIPRASLQGGNLAGRENYGDATASTAWSI